MRFGGSIDKIALLGGTGKLGRGLALRWCSKRQVIIGSRFRPKAEAATEEVRQLVREKRYADNIRGMLNREAAREADLVIFCVGLGPALRLATRIRGALKDKLVLSPIVSMGHRGNLRTPKLNPPNSAAVKLAKALGQRSNVVSGLHTIPAFMLYSPDPLHDYSVVIYGEQPAKGIVMRLVNEIDGLHSLDGGPLEMSFLSEYATPLLLNLKKLNESRVHSVRYY